MGSSSSTSCSEGLGKDKCGVDRGPGPAGRASAQLPRKSATPEVAVPGSGILKLGEPKGWKACRPGVRYYLSSARMPTERDASAVTASTSSASAPGTLGTQDSGQEARRCMQPQYLPGTRSRVKKGWGKEAPPRHSTHPRLIQRLHISGQESTSTGRVLKFGAGSLTCLYLQHNAFPVLAPTNMTRWAEQIQHGYAVA